MFSNLNSGVQSLIPYMILGYYLNPDRIYKRYVCWRLTGIVFIRNSLPWPWSMSDFSKRLINKEGEILCINILLKTRMAK